MVCRVVGRCEILNRNNVYVLSIWGIYPRSGICVSLWEYPGLCSLERPWALPIMEFMGPDSPALAICTSRSRSETGTLLRRLLLELQSSVSDTPTWGRWQFSASVLSSVEIPDSFLSMIFPWFLLCSPFSEVLWDLNILSMRFFYARSSRQLLFWVFDSITYK